MKREPLPFSEAPFCERPRSRSLPPNSAGQKLQNEEIAATPADAAAAAASTIGSRKKNEWRDARCSGGRKGTIKLNLVLSNICVSHEGIEI